MNDNEKIKSLLIEKLDLKQAFIVGDNNHIKITAIGDIFIGITSVKRQKMVYAPLIKMITKQKIHAVSIFCYTLKEWEKNTNNTDISK